MQRVCAWCNKSLDNVPSIPKEDRVISHGICDDCISNIKAQMGVPLNEFLDGLKAPIFLVDSDVVVIAANTAARGLLGKDPDRIEGLRGGDVFECAYARLPGGCGKTVHCSGCAIRRSVTETYRTGDSHLRTPAYLNRHELDRTRRLDMMISTERVGDIVLLRIDRINFPEE
jgi:PAS domain-containing protein